jgi:hypothetical protein
MPANDNEAAAPAGESRRPNPEAIAWYVGEAQRLLEDQQRRAESLRTRGGQVAGFGAAVLALIGGNVSGLLGPLDGAARTVAGIGLVVGSLLLAIAVTAAAWGALRPRVFIEISAEEIFRFASKRFLVEPDLWRVQVRSIHSLGRATRSVQEAADSAAAAIAWALLAFLAGLGFAFISIATLIIESI